MSCVDEHRNEDYFEFKGQIKKLQHELAHIKKELHIAEQPGLKTKI